MWLLEHEGDIFSGKKRWLRPGTVHLLGRTNNHKDGEQPRQTHHIDAKTVSRKHLLIEIGQVDESKGSDLDHRSILTLTDDSSFFTHVNGEQLHKSSRTFSGDVLRIKLGKWDKLFKITWQPVVFSLNLSSKKKASRDPLASYRSKLGPLDIKVLAQFDSRTTHVVADKRNTSIGLQALVSGKPIVTEAYIDAVDRAAKPGASSDANAPPTALLEDDFTQWPPELDYLPAAGKEPVPREPALFLPNAARSDVFKGYTFIFCDEVQHATLEPMLTLGSGKVFLFELDAGRTNPGEFVRFIKAKIGEDTLGELEDNSEGPGAVCIRSRGTEQWIIDLQAQVQLQLNQRDVEQNEFLDAVLMNDASVLRRKLQTVDEIEIPSSSQVNGVEPTASDLRPQGETSQPSAPADQKSPSATQRTFTRRKPTRVVTRKFKGFEDSDEEDAPRAPADDEDVVMDGASQSQISEIRPPSQSLQSQVGGTAAKKRPYEDQIEKENTDHLYPAAAAMKRRKLQQEQSQNAGNTGTTQTSPAKNKAADIEQLRAAVNRREKDIDVKEALREQQEKKIQEEEQRRIAEEEDGMLDDEEIRGLRDLVIIEEMEIKPRSERSQRGETRPDDWNERWNGRKNFKKFKKQGSRDAPMRGQRVIVALEEIKKKDYGIGEDYWLDGGNSGRHSTTQASRLDDDILDTSLQRKRSGKPFRRPASTIQDESVDIDTELPEVAALSRSIAAKQEQALSQTVREDSNPPASITNKRPAPAPAVQPPSAKRGRINTSRFNVDDDGDATAFKFKRGRRG